MKKRINYPVIVVCPVCGFKFKGRKFEQFIKLNFCGSCTEKAFNNNAWDGGSLFVWDIKEA
jgi:uncharacterized protein (DUF983 family)